MWPLCWKLNEPGQIGALRLVAMVFSQVKLDLGGGFGGFCGERPPLQATRVKAHQYDDGSASSRLRMRWPSKKDVDVFVLTLVPFIAKRSE